MQKKRKVDSGKLPISMKQVKQTINVKKPDGDHIEEDEYLLADLDSPTGVKSKAQLEVDESGEIDTNPG